MHALAGQYGEVRAPFRIAKKTLSRRSAASLVRGGLVESNAFLACAVKVFGVAQTRFLRGADEGPRNRMSVAAVGYLLRPIYAMKFVGEALIAFEGAKYRQYLVVRPVPATHLRPGVVVLLLSADVNHRIYRTAAAENIALRHDGRPPIQSLLAFGCVEMDVHALLDHLEEGRRDMDVTIGILAAAFDQQHPVGRTFR